MADFREELKRITGIELGSTRSNLDRVKQIFFADRGLLPYNFQQEAISRIGVGHNTLIVAGTAQGKTEAVIVPVVARLLDDGRKYICCYIAPTRALLNDLYSRLQHSLAKLRLCIAIRHGDRHIDQDDPNIDVILTTPESLDVMLTQKAPILQRVRVVVVDEVHQCYGTPRGAHIISLLERLKWSINKEKSHELQRIALSATVGNPQSVAAWIQGTDSPLEIITSLTSRNISATVEWCGTDTSASRWIAGTGYQKIIAFVNSRRHCEELASALEKVSDAEVLVHYSDLSVSDREFVESRFRRADRAICVATGTLELGIDIGNIDAVAMIDPAFSVQSFLQRIGRASRTQTTVPVLLVANTETCLAHQLALLSLGSEGSIEDEPYMEWFSVLAQQILSMVASNDRRRIFEKLPWEIFGCWPWFSEETTRQLLNGLAASDFLQREEQIRSYRQGRNMALLMDGWGVSANIAGVYSGRPLYYGQRRIGSLELGGACHEGEVLRYAGRYWRVLGSSATSISVEPSDSVPNPRLPRWSGRRAGSLSRLVAQRIRALLLGTASITFQSSPALEERWHEILARSISLQRRAEVIWESRIGPSFTYYTFAGHLENEMLRLLLDQQGFSARLAKGQTIGGIALASNQALAFPGSTIENVRHVQNDRWRALRWLVQTGPFFDQMPNPLRRREILSQVGAPDLLQRLSRQREVISIPGPLLRENALI